MEKIEKKQSAILFLDRNGFYFYMSGMENVATCLFPETVVKDLEIVDPFGVENQIKAFMNQWNIPAVDITMIISQNITFEKSITAGSGELDEIVKFLDSVPFERFEKIVIAEGGNKMVFAVNKNLTYCIEVSFARVGCIVSTILPYYPLANLLQTLPLDVVSAQAILKKVNDLKSYNMKRVEEIHETKTNTTVSQPAPKTNKKRIYIMVGFFIVLIIVMIFMLIRH